MMRNFSSQQEILYIWRCMRKRKSSKDTKKCFIYHLFCYIYSVFNYDKSLGLIFVNDTK